MKKMKLNKFRVLLIVLAITLFVTITLAWIFYTDLPYEFWRLTISRLGGNLIRDDIENPIGPNKISSLIFTIGLSICGVICLLLLIFTIVDFKKKQYRWTNLFCFISMAIGAFFIGIPRDHDTLSILHYVGVGVFILSFLFFNSIAQFYHRRKEIIKRGLNFWDVFISMLLIIIVVVHVITFILVWINPAHGESLRIWNALSQKAVVIVCIGAIFFLDNEDLVRPAKIKEEKTN